MGNAAPDAPWQDNVTWMLAWMERHDGATWTPPSRDGGNTLQGRHTVTWPGADGLEQASDHDLGRLCDYLRSIEHVPAPRQGEMLYRHGIPSGTAGMREPHPRDYPLTCICTCGRTIDRASADDAWRHREWSTQPVG